MTTGAGGCPRHLRCEYLVNPLGLGERRPRLSWELQDPRRGARQTAFQIQVATSPGGLEAGEADLHDSGKVVGSRSIHHPYAGPLLSSRQRCWWRVRVWDHEGRPSPWSPAAWWEMGLLAPADWQAVGLGVPPAPADGGPWPAVHLRRVLELPGAPARARAYATAHGLYELHVNGARVGDAHFTPGWTEYGHRLLVQTWDVTGLLRPGENVLGALLAEGWYVGQVGWAPTRVWGDHPELLVQLEVELADGQRVVVATDDRWRASPGSIQAAGLLAGETIDARAALPGWSEPGYDDSAWVAPATRAWDLTPLVASPGPHVRPWAERPGFLRAQPEPGRYLFDLGQNLVGWVRLSVAGERGTRVQVRHAEVLDADGELYTECLRTARATDTFILAGVGEPETFEPRFTFHGFRHVEVSGAPSPPEVTGVVATTELPATGEFSCSSDLVTRLQQNIVWSQRGNFLEVPTDCPQRDERLGWTGDAQIFARTACWNLDSAAFLASWLQDLADAQREDGAVTHVAPNVITGDDGQPAAGSAGWGDAMVIVPWTLYCCYGDTRVLRRHRQAMTRWLGWLCDHSTEGLRPADGFGDWLAVAAATPKDLVATAFFAHVADLMQRISRVLGDAEGVARYRELGASVRRAFQHEFVRPEGRILGETQTGYVLALAFDLLPESVRGVAAGHLVQLIEARDGHLSTGFLGTPHLLDVLTASGHLDVAYRLLLQETCPSWGYPIVAADATTIWERWDGWTPSDGFADPGMNSFNHYAYGAVGAWLYRVVAGIDLDPDEPAYGRVRIHPRPGGGLTWARGALRSMHGTVSSHWRLEEPAGFGLDVTLPPNARGTIVLPATDLSRVTEGGRPVRRAPGVLRARASRGEVVVEVGAGTYSFRVPGEVCSCSGRSR